MADTEVFPSVFAFWRHFLCHAEDFKCRAILFVGPCCHFLQHRNPADSPRLCLYLKVFYTSSSKSFRLSRSTSEVFNPVRVYFNVGSEALFFHCSTSGFSVFPFSEEAAIWWSEWNQRFHRLLFSSNWSPVGGAVWEELGDVVFLEEVCHGEGSETSKTSCCFWIKVQAVSCSCQQTSVPPLWTLTLWNWKPS